MGLRYRVDYLVRATGVAVRPDVVFVRSRVALFIDGCFWHGCPLHRTTPVRNSNYWGPKLRSNAERDRRVAVALVDAGWRVLRAWEHECPTDVADRVLAELAVIKEV